jgi:predicted exporter
MNQPARTTGLKRPTVWVLMAWATLMLLGLWQITRTPFVADLSAFLPKNPDAQQRVLIEQLESGAPSRLLLMGIEGGTASERAQASRAFAKSLRSSGLFDQVQNGERDGFAAIGSFLFEHRYQLSPAVDAAHFTAAGLQAALTDTLSLLGTPAGEALKPLLPRDPTGETQRIAEALIPAQAPRTEEGVWASRAEGAAVPRALLLAGTRAAGADLDGQQAALAAVHQAFKETSAGLPALTLKVSGAPVFAVQSRAQIEREVNWLALVGTLMMSALLWLAFASPLALLVAMLPVATGVVLGIAGVGLFFGNVHGVTLGFGATLIGEAVDYGIYYLIQARPADAQRKGWQPGQGWRLWLATGWPTVRLGLWTSLCGFAALVFSGFPGLAQLGVFSIVGLLGAAGATRYVLPHLMPDGAKGQGARRALGTAALWAVQRLPSWRWPLLVLSVAALALLWQRGDLWKADLTALSPLPKDALALDAQLRADLSASDARTLVVVQGPDAETTLQRTEAVAAKLDALTDSRVIAGYDSVTRFVPSVATQRARLGHLPEPAAVQAALGLATRGGPLDTSKDPERLTPFVNDLQAARTQVPVTLASVQNTALAPLVNALILRRADGSYSALLPLQALPANASPSNESATATANANVTANTNVNASSGLDQSRVEAALRGLPGAQVLDIKQSLDGLYQRYLHEALWQALAGAAAVVALIALALRQVRRIWAVCLPLALAVLLSLAGLALAGVPLGILHLVGLLLVVAVGSNYALFFDMLQHSAPNATAAAPAPLAGTGTGLDSDTLASLLLANLTTVASFGLLAFSEIPALSAIGRVVAPGALLALVLAAALIPRRTAGARN